MVIEQLDEIQEIIGLSRKLIRELWEIQDVEKRKPGIDLLIKYNTALIKLIENMTRDNGNSG